MRTKNLTAREKRIALKAWELGWKENKGGIRCCSERELFYHCAKRRHANQTRKKGRENATN